jgi:hypothetical protein
MIVKFLAKSRTFKGVRYNTNKVEKNKGELMKVSGFGPLQGLSQLMPQDYINYLQMVSTRNKRVIYPQLHAVISAKGKESSKEELTDIAEKWLSKMGYAEQPYLIIFHKDTRNHHVHLVSTRVEKSSGKKISSAFEKIRAMTAINKVLRLDPVFQAKADLDKAMGYNFQTKAQFMMVLESKGYTLQEEKGKMSLVKFGRVLCDLDLSFLKDRKSEYQVNQARASQITALLHKYRDISSVTLRHIVEPLPGGSQKERHGYTSDLAQEFSRMFGIQLIFHGSEGMAPYGYSILDHDKGNVFKGGEIMDMDLLLAEQVQVPEIDCGMSQSLLDEPSEVHNERQAELKSVFDYPEDFARLNSAEAQQLINSCIQQLNNSDAQQISNDSAFEPLEQVIQISISDDIDDEAIHGRNRHRKRQARTNSR